MSFLMVPRLIWMISGRTQRFYDVLSHDRMILRQHFPSNNPNVCHLSTSSCCGNDNASLRANISLSKQEKEQNATDLVEKLDEDKTRRLNELILHYEYALHQGKEVPKKMTNRMWLEMLDCKTNGACLKLFRKFYKLEIVKQKREMQKLQRKEERQQVYKNKEMKTSSFDERLYVRFQKSDVTFSEDLNMANGMMLNQPVVLDLSFEDSLDKHERRLLMKPLLNVYTFNRRLMEPFHLMFCNANRDGELIHTLSELSGRTISQLPVTITDKSYLDVYPRDRLVYLTPDSRHNYVYNPQDIPIIGVCTDLYGNRKQSLRTAKRNGIRHGKFPIDLYLRWNTGQKSLDITSVLQIWSIVADTKGDWKQAFHKIIPSALYS